MNNKIFTPIIPEALAHICVTVDSIDDATVLYKKLFDAQPIKHFLPVRDANWSKNIGFSENYNKVEVSNRFLLVPGVNLYIELLEYHSPPSKKIIQHKPNTIQGISHICLTVPNIDQAFEYVKTFPELKIKCALKDYKKPLNIAVVKEEDFYFFDEQLENDPRYKNKAAYMTNTIRFFNFIDPYGVTWELLEGEERYGF